MHHKQREKLFNILDAYALEEQDFDDTWLSLRYFCNDLKTASQRDEFLKGAMLNFVTKARGEGVINAQKANQCMQTIIDWLRTGAELSFPSRDDAESLAPREKTKTSLNPQSDFTEAVQAVKREIRQPGYLQSAEFEQTRGLG